MSENSETVGADRWLSSKDAATYLGVEACTLAKWRQHGVGVGPLYSAGHRRKVYHFVEAGVLPVFRIGSIICARQTILRDWLGEQERGRAA